MLGIIFAVAAGLFLLERLWPAHTLPRIEGWWARVVLVNAVQLGIVVVAGFSWDRWLQSVSLFELRSSLGTLSQAAIAYFVSTFVYYWWHRFRHESAWFWRLCHQLHHSPQRIELVTSFYKHPVEVTCNSLISAGLVYTLLGCSVQAGALYTLLTALAEFFYHLNLRTPHWLGFLFQRPEAHRVHHQYRHHTQNFADLPIWDMLFGTFRNPHRAPSRCGFDDWREDRFDDIIAFRDVHAPGSRQRPPLRLLPTCFGCRKRWACVASADSTRSADSEGSVKAE